MQIYLETLFFPCSSLPTYVAVVPGRHNASKMTTMALHTALCVCNTLFIRREVNQSSPSVRPTIHPTIRPSVRPAGAASPRSYREPACPSVDGLPLFRDVKGTRRLLMAVDGGRETNTFKVRRTTHHQTERAGWLTGRQAGRQAGRVQSDLPRRRRSIIMSFVEEALSFRRGRRHRCCC